MYTNNIKLDWAKGFNSMWKLYVRNVYKRNAGRCTAHSVQCTLTAHSWNRIFLSIFFLSVGVYSEVILQFQRFHYFSYSLYFFHFFLFLSLFILNSFHFDCIRRKLIEIVFHFLRYIDESVITRTLSFITFLWFFLWFRSTTAKAYFPTSITSHTFLPFLFDYDFSGFCDEIFNKFSMLCLYV